MESVQTQILTAPPGKAKPAATGAAAASDFAADPQKGFPALLLSLMGIALPKDAAADMTLMTALKPEEMEHDGVPVVPAGIPDAAPLPMMTLPIALLPPMPEAAASGLSAELMIAGRVRPCMDAATEKLDSAPSMASGAPVPAGTAEFIASGENQPRLSLHAADPHTGRPVTPHPQHALEALAEHRDAAVTNLPVPEFTQGMHSLHPLHPMHPAHPSPAAAAHIETPIGTPEWSAEFAQKIVWLAGEKQHTAELHVNPPDLGPLHIRLATDENQTSAIFTSPHSDVREAIEAALPRLREVLADSGITLGQASVTADSPRDGSAFDRQRHPAPVFSGDADSDVVAASSTSQDVVRGRGNGLVDLFA
ncbi:MAG: flagellar hook-length control protein FliK [Burkholderiales bacterium]